MKPVATVKQLSRKSWLGWAAAASIALLIGWMTIFYVQLTDNQLTFTTGNGQRLPIDLPDGSSIQLNANSSLYYYPNQWKEQATRKIWLEGEAFFKVQRKVEDVKFMVHAGGMEIAVLGTQFNVRARGEKAEVVLEEGKVELAIDKQKITMTPGDLVSYSTISNEINSKKVKTEEYVAWKDGITIFNDSLKEVVKELEILYGIRFSIQNKALENRMIQLSAPTNSLEQVLETLELLYPEEIHIEQQDDQIIIL